MLRYNRVGSKMLLWSRSRGNVITDTQMPYNTRETSPISPLVWKCLVASTPRPNTVHNWWKVSVSRPTVAATDVTLASVESTASWLKSFISWPVTVKEYNFKSNISNYKRNLQKRCIVRKWYNQRPCKLPMDGRQLLQICGWKKALSQPTQSHNRLLSLL